MGFLLKMCGIAGIITKSNCIDFKSALGQMLAVLRHRGPDHTDMRVLDGRAYLGFNRLSIVDLSENGNQPLFNEDNTLALVLNGEIYNYIELRKELSSLGHRFASETDAETVLHAYEQWEEDCFEHIRGMFAFTIWDLKKNELFLARDRIGIKPLYYLAHKEAFIFASELKAFTTLPREFWSPNLEKQALDLYFHFPFINDNVNTLFDGVKKIPPGHFALLRDGSLKVQRYWRLEKNEKIQKLSLAEAEEQTEEILREAIECHFIGDVPIALMLSGGLDSSLITALALKSKRNVEVAITVGSNSLLDERKYARIVANHLGCKHIELEINPNEAADEIEDLVWYFDDLSGIGFFYQMFMSRKIRELGLKVVLTGEGADEVFGGYHIFKLSSFPFSVLPSRIWNMFYYKMLSGRKFGRDYFKYSSLIKKGIFHPGVDVHNICSQFEIEQQLPNYILMAVDKGFMSHSVEARVPYLDHKVVEFVYSLPQSYKLNGYFFSRKHEIVKYILRRIGPKYLPQDIVMRKKQGVGLSIMSIIKSNKDKVRDYLLSSNSTVKMLFDKKIIANALEDEEKNAFFLNRLYIFELWARQYLSSSRSCKQ